MRLFKKLSDSYSVQTKRKILSGLLLGLVIGLSFQNCSPSQFSTRNLSQIVGVNTQLSVDLIENSQATSISDSSVKGIEQGQIFQRKDSGLATIGLDISEVVPKNLKYYSVSEVNSSNQRQRVLASGLVDSATHFNFEYSTGMAARKVSLSFYDENRVEQRRWISPEFSVGEVFLIAGQSNASNHGQSPTKSNNPLNRGFDPITKKWVPLVDPLPYGSNWAMPPWSNDPSVNPGGSAWPSFADDLSSKLNVPVGVVSVGWGGTPMSMWVRKPQEFFWRMYTGAKALPRLDPSVASSACGFRAVLWHQGESDAWDKTPPEDFKKDFSSLYVLNVFSAGCGMTFIVARASYLGIANWTSRYQISEAEAENMKWNSELGIRSVQNYMASNHGSFFLGPDTDLMVARHYRYDDLHFSVEGLGIHGKLWSQKVLAWMGRPSLSEKDLIPEVATVWNLFAKVLNRTESDMAQDSEGLRYYTSKYSLGKLTEAQITDILKNSTEAFVRSVYAENFRRQPSWSEVTNWLQKFESGAIANRDSLRAEILKTK